MKVTYYGHSCFAVEIQGKNLLFDPFISPNELAKNIEVNSIQADYIFVSHGHEDHMADANSIAKRTGATLVSNWEIATWFSKQGIQNYHPMNHGGWWNFDFGRVKYVYSTHSSSLPDGSNGGNPGGFIIISKEGNFYYSGDTALNMDMQLIPRWAKLDFALLPIGNNFTMDADDAIVAADFIQCQKIVGVHYDTFGFIKINHQESINKFKNAGKELLLLNIGEMRNL